MTTETVKIPIPIVRPLGTTIDKAIYVHEMWEVFVVPDQEARMPQSIEMRMLMATLRSLHDGLHAIEPCEKCVDTEVT